MRIERERQGLKILVVDDDAAICSLAGACEEIAHAAEEIA